MTQISETGANPTQLAAALRDGLEALDLNQQFTFQAYTRVVLPIDGCVFWSPTHTLLARGSLHYGQEIVQNDDETYGQATVTFTSEDQITEFTSAPVNTIYVATAAGFRFVFSQQQVAYAQAGPLWHYFGRSIPPALSTQLLDRPNAIDPSRAITSNSLALWLALNSFQSAFDLGFNTQGVPFIVAPPTLFPSRLVPPNQVPPYGSVAIGENDTEAWQVTPTLDAHRNHNQLCKDRVRIELYGLQSDECQDFMDTVNQYSRLTNNFGILNMPVMRDAKRAEPGLQTVAMKKVIEYEIDYQQNRVAQVARQLITSCVPTVIVQ